MEWKMTIMDRNWSSVSKKSSILLFIMLKMYKSWSASKKLKLITDSKLFIDKKSDILLKHEYSVLF